ncbi:ParA family protein [Flexithrix dorotheae]|uniref:ParA family protein n=1 Tax=Flexithrix dorotheae TaxID=70993 RepID=UPI000375F05C|nr:AAA family ATPase [Flexithrix dorotheae]
MVLAISNQKGGVGKTTSVGAIGAAFAKMGKRVIMIDLDPQANLSTGLGISEPDTSIDKVLFGECSVEEAVYEIGDNLYLIPCTKSLGSFEIEMLNEIGRENLLKKQTKSLKEVADIIILDTAPSLGLLTVNALAFSDHVIVPIHAEKFSIDGLNEVLITISKIKEDINPGITFSGAFFTQFNKQKLLTRAMETEVIELIGENLLYKNRIRINVALQEAYALGKTVFEYAPDSNGAKDYLKLSQEIGKSINLHQSEMVAK